LHLRNFPKILLSRYIAMKFVTSIGIIYLASSASVTAMVEEAVSLEAAVESAFTQIQEASTLFEEANSQLHAEGMVHRPQFTYYGQQLRRLLRSVKDSISTMRPHIQDPAGLEILSQLDASASSLLGSISKLSDSSIWSASPDAWPDTDAQANWEAIVAQFTSAGNTLFAEATEKIALVLSTSNYTAPEGAAAAEVPMETLHLPFKLRTPLRKFRAEIESALQSVAEAEVDALKVVEKAGSGSLVDLKHEVDMIREVLTLKRVVDPCYQVAQSSLESASAQVAACMSSLRGAVKAGAGSHRAIAQLLSTAQEGLTAANRFLGKEGGLPVTIERVLARASRVSECSCEGCNANFDWEFANCLDRVYDFAEIKEGLQSAGSAVAEAAASHGKAFAKAPVAAVAKFACAICMDEADLGNLPAIRAISCVRLALIISVRRNPMHTAVLYAEPQLQQGSRFSATPACTV
jgi:hypothetical protein